MSKKTPTYFCSSCQATFFRWAGKCSTCHAWNTIQQIPDSPTGRFEASKQGVPSRTKTYSDPIPIHLVQESQWERISTGFSELDIVFGGGIVPGSLVLLGGEPGVGKSTLVLELTRQLAKSGKVLYISGEESAVQIGLRAKRMGVFQENVLLSSELYAENIARMIEDIQPKVVFIDSIQTVIKQSLENQAGTITQLRECTQVFLETAKRTGIPIFLIGHITKEGSIAGPKVLEHLVDTVLYFEGDRLNYYRLLRAVKNRFGAVGDTAVLEMVSNGLKQVTDRNSLFLSQEMAERSGSVLSSVMEGSRAISVEVQALVTKSSFGQARRMAEGLDTRRVILLSAVMEKYLDYPLGASDIFSNLAGGLEIDEPSLDLAIAGAISSSYRDKAFSGRIAMFGEVGLSGEIRSVGQIGLRVKELVSLGIHKIYLPWGNYAEAKPFEKEAQLEPLKHIRELKNI